MFKQVQNPYEFDKHGINGITLLSEACITSNEYASYDLSILETPKGFQFAHGCIIDPTVCTSETQAQAAALTWYINNRQFKAKQG